MDPSQSWRLLAAMFVHVGLQHFCFEHGYPLFYRKNRRRSIWLEGLFSPLPLIRLDGQPFLSWSFSPEVVAAGASTALAGPLCCHCQFTFYRP